MSRRSLSPFSLSDFPFVLKKGPPPKIGMPFFADIIRYDTINLYHSKTNAFPLRNSSTK